MRVGRLVFVGGSVVALAVVVAASCAVYDESLLVSAEGGADAGAEASEGGGCVHIRWPERPTADDPSSGDLPTLYNAARTLDFGVREDGGPPPLIGFDLDNFCTCTFDPESCKVVGDASHCDLEGGVDNAGLILVRQFSAFPGFFQQSYINDRINTGYYTAIISVANYNGQANDTQVEVAYYPSNGMKGIQIGIPQVPSWDGNDEWTIDPSSGAIDDAGITPKYVDKSAYVRDYTVVANLSFPVSIGASAGDNTLVIDLTGAVVMAKLIPNGNAFRVEQGIISGRWTTNKMLTSLQVLRDPFSQDRLCGSNTTYTLIKDKICQAADIASNILEDGKGAPCAALTVGIEFASYPAKINGVYPRNDAGAPCGVSWTDDCPKK